MKTRNILLGLSVCAALCACTDNDVTVTGGSGQQQTFSGDNAYMAVRISDVGSSQTRATSPGFEYGTKKEQEVKDAYFYFYDGDGLFVSQGEVWEGGEGKSSEDDTTAGSIEFESNTVIILKGLTQKNYPKYVVTVLNKPAGLVNDRDIPETLDEMVKKLADDDGVGIMLDEKEQTYFTMSTTSFAGQNITSDNVTTPLYFVTEVTDSDFHKEPVAYSGDNLVDEDGTAIEPVDIYVERLAAKVKLGVDLDNDSIVVNGRKLYKIEETIAGDANLKLDENKEYAAQAIYIDLLGWKLNATARHSNIVKNINENWTDDYLNFTWNDPTNHRSYWGKSFNYGIDADYPGNSAGNASEDETKEATELNKYLKYVNLADEEDSPLLSLNGGYDYCAENTNTAGGTDGIIQHRNSSVITSILVKAQICDSIGKPQSVVRYSGELFTEEAYLNYIMLYLTQTGRLNLYTSDTDEDGNDVYSHLGAQYVKLGYLRDQEYEGIDESDNIDSYVAIVPEEDALASAVLYKKGDSGYEPISMDDATAALESALEAFNPTAKAEGYNDGLMYYNIPIEHLNNTYGDEIAEANYGVVRNHYYYATITELENLGKGIYDEGEVIVPNPDDDEKETYYIGAKINILSWKVVQQDVKL